MSGTGTRWTAAIAAAVGAIGAVTLAAVGLLPGQASNEAVRASAPAAITVPLGGLGVGSITSHPTPTTSPEVPTSPTTSLVPDTTTLPVTSTTESTSATTAPATTTPTTAAPAARSTDTPPNTSGAGGGSGSPGPAVDDSTCSILKEILGLVDDPGVAQALKDEMRASGCPT